MCGPGFSVSGRDPWPPILGLLSALSSDALVEVVHRAGLVIDLTLTGQESFSHKTRVRAYLPRIQTAYSALPDAQKRSILAALAGEVAKEGRSIDQINSVLANVGWRYENGNLTPQDQDAERFFPKGSEHDAYTHIRKILQGAKSDLLIVDPYIDGSILDMISSIPAPSLIVKVLTSNLPSDFALQAKKFMAQYRQFSLQVRTTREFHDRFIVVDLNQCYHIGASLKDAGHKAFMISKLEDRNNIDALMKQQVEAWSAALPLAI
jgi:hypothetical protein